jgi:hypothetical protein
MRQGKEKRERNAEREPIILCARQLFLCSLFLFLSFLLSGQTENQRLRPQSLFCGRTIEGDHSLSYSFHSPGHVLKHKRIGNWPGDEKE